MLSAFSWTDDAFRLVISASPREVQRAIETDYSFGSFTRGEEKENLLMAALKTSREADVVNMLMSQAKISPDSKTKDGKTAFMYACQYETDISVIKDVLNFNAPSDKDKSRRILARDTDGLTCFDYARKNELISEEVLGLLGLYAQEPADEPEENPEPEDSEEVAESEPVPKVSPPPPLEDIPENDDSAEPAEETFIGDFSYDVPDALTEEVPPDVNSIFDLALAPTPLLIPESLHLYDYADDKASPLLIPEALVAAEEAARHYIADANRRDSSGKTKLMIAAKQGDISKIEDLLYSGAQIDAKDDEGWTALMYAARFQKNADVTKLLLLKGADRTQKNNYGLTALLLASGYAKNADVISLLLDSCSPDSDEAREAFAYGISSYNDTQALNAFVKKNVPVNIPFNGKTPLMLACQTGRNTKIIEWLLANGASKYQVEAQTGKTAFDYAKENKKLPHNVTYWSLNPNS